MTDQDNSNSTSDKEPTEVVTQEPVTEYTLCENYMRQYKKYKLGMLEGEFFTIREQQAFTASMIGDHNSMQAFIANTVSLIQVKAIEEFPVTEEVLECVNSFHLAVYGVVFTIVVPLMKMPEATKKAIRDKYRADMEALRDIDKAIKGEGAEEAPLDAGLDFSLPDLKPYVHPDGG